ncbi:TIM barrel protein [Psychromonas sp. SR45-3]|uniref:TIM barrel protein n=1 Tax=Psychromonas sp. SR45-3 TaxID=2760930 RepID=UPI0015FA703C|nr:TIM barrel protein [Psychromonas sp. SR45-3]MBB1272486.1 TIM barrel protein [Psychromonas sp. SR45-3]
MHIKRTKLSPSLCIDAVFGNLSFDQACQATAHANISTIEFWSWWDKDLTALQVAVERYDLSISCCCTKFISLVNAEQRSAYLQALSDSIAVAKRLKIKTIISQVGDFIEGVPRAQQKQSLIDGLTAAALLLEAADMTLVVEPLNERIDHPGYYLIKSAEAFNIIKQVSSPKVKVLFDIYHQQISEGNIINNIRENIDYIGHFHAAGHPGRHELQRGEINYPEIFSAIKQTNFSGYIGLEYWPLTDNTIEPLQEVVSWLK